MPCFLDNCRRDAALARQAAEAGDWQLAARIGHNLKGSAPSYGFEEISRFGREIELAAKAFHSERITGAASRLADHLSLLCVRPL